MNANYFTEVLLPMHIKLQGLYREKCGPLQNNDIFYCPHCQKCHTLFSGLLHSVNMDCKTAIRDMILVPETVSRDSSPEASNRSLVGMCDDLISIDNNGKDGWAVNIMLDKGLTWNEKSYKGTTSTEAILRALCHQEGIE